MVKERQGFLNSILDSYLEKPGLIFRKIAYIHDSFPGISSVTP
jgi:hypothetical protein